MPLRFGYKEYDEALSEIADDDTHISDVVQELKYNFKHLSTETRNVDWRLEQLEILQDVINQNR